MKAPSTGTLQHGGSFGAGRANECREPVPQRLLVPEFALPHHCNTKSKPSHRRLLASITCPVGYDLLAPPLAVRPGKPRERTPLVTVPEAPVHEYAPLTALVRDVWRPGKISRTNAKALPDTVNDATDRSLRRGVALPHRPHAGGRFACRSNPRRRCR